MEKPRNVEKQINIMVLSVCKNRQLSMSYVFRRAIALLVLSAMIFLSANFFSVETAKAEAQKPAVVESLSDRARKAVIADLSKQTGIPKEKLKITRSSRKTWSNGCLGLAKPEEICTQALVEGWRVVVVSENNRTWVYRSDRNGRILRLESPNSSTGITN